MANVFISSTYKDLKDYRKRVSESIRKMGHTDIAMEYYGAEDKRPLEKCLEDVAACSLYIGIFAWRYGHVPPKHEYSITELEYRKARECNNPCLIFLLRDDASWPMTLVEIESFAKIDALRNELSKNHLPAFFSSIDELGECVVEAIHIWDKDKSVPALTPQNVQELMVEGYYNAFLKRYKILDLDALTPPEKADFIEIQLRSIFVEQDVRENPPPIEIPKELMEKLIKDERLKKEDLPDGITFEDIKKAREAYLEKPTLPVLDVITNKKNHCVVILGDPGSGKSTLSRYIVLSIITKEDETLTKYFEKYLPILIELRDYAAECARNKCDTFVEYLDFLGRTKGYGLNKETLDNYLRNDGKAVVIFDGLDEIFDLNQRENIEKEIIGFTVNYPKVQIIVTSRIVGYKRRILTNAGFSHYTLQDFKRPQIDIFIDKWYNIALINNSDEVNARKNRLYRSLEDVSSIKQLSGNPLLLTIIAIINKHQELPRERWRLYEHASSVLIHHWDWERRIKDWNIKIEYICKDDKEELLRQIAYNMQSAPKSLAGNYIHADTLQTEFEKYFMVRYQKNPPEAKLAAQILIEQLRERNFILCRYGSNLYGFIHRTFLEFFCAWSIVWKFNIKHELDIETLKTIFDEHWDDESWHEVLRLICGMIDGKFAESLINYLMQKPSSDQLDIVREKVDKFSDMFDYRYRQLNLDDDFTSNPECMLCNLRLRCNKRNSKYREDFSDRKEIYFTIWKAKRLDLAIKCMGELKNIELIRKTSSKLLEETCKLIEWNMKDSSYINSGLSRFINYNIISSATTIGKRWSGREQLIEWIPIFVNIINSNKNHMFYSSEINVGKFIGSIGSGDTHIRETVKSLLQNNAGIIRKTALIALEFGWHDHPDTLKLLKDHALNDFDGDVCKTAVLSISKRWWRGDSDILVVLQKYALSKEDYSIRQTAIQLVSGFCDNSCDFFFLCDLVKSPYQRIKIRKFSAQQIVKIWKRNINALTFFKDCVENDANPEVRKIAISLLYEEWRDDPIVLSMLRERAYKDINPVVRDFINKTLATKDV